MFEELVQQLQRFNSRDLLAKVGALHLLPENASRASSLDLLAHVVASIPFDSNAPDLEWTELSRLLKEYFPPNSTNTWHDDPCDQIFAEEIVFYGGSYLVLAGINTDITDNLRRLFKAIFLRRTALGPPSFRTEALNLCIASLTVMDDIARSAGLKRGLLPDTDKCREIAIPPEADRRLTDVVSFSDVRLKSLLSRRKLSPDVIGALTVSAGAISLSSYTLSEGPLHRVPLIRCGNVTVIPEPAAILVALQHEVLCLARKYEVLTDVADSFQKAVWQELIKLLQFWQFDHLPLADEHSGPFKEALFRLDTDKAIYVQLATDSLEAFSPEEAFGHWDTTQVEPLLENRQNEVITFLMNQKGGPEHILLLTLVQPLGRSVAFSLPERQDGFLRAIALNVSDFSVITQVDCGEPLALWKFAVASERIRERCEIVVTSFLDEYELYRSHQRSYYVSDGPVPDLIAVTPGMGLDMRKRAYERSDSHGVISFDGTGLTEVWLLSGKGMPLYTSPDEIVDRVCIVVEGLPTPFWVVGPNTVPPHLRSICFHIAEMIGYWIWQCTPFLRAPVAAASRRLNHMSIYFDFAAPDRWTESHLGNVVTTIEPLESVLQTINCNPATGDIAIEILPAFRFSIYGQDNAGERRLIADLFRALKAMLIHPEPGEEDLMADERISNALDLYAPLGSKKKLYMLPIANRPEVDPRGLPPFRPVQEAEYAEILDGLGEHLRSRGWRKGLIGEPSAKIQALNQAVEHLFSKLESLITTFEPESLIRTLVARQESITRTLYTLRLQIPTRIACFPDNEENRPNRLTEEQSKIALANTANRFLIEYAAARPPEGQKAPSLELYDRLLAISADIIEFGWFSDHIHFKIADFRLVILPSGRLAISSDGSNPGMAFAQAHMRGEIIQFQDIFSSHWRESSQSPAASDDERPSLTDIDQAFKCEFGIGLLQLRHFVQELVKIGEPIDGLAKMQSLRKLTTDLTAALEWNRADVDRAFELLSLRPRKQFLGPPNHRTEEVYPWRYSRDLSHQRRPLVISPVRGEEYVFWGKRHLIQSFRYFVGLCTSGRLKATSPELMRTISMLRGRASRAFERTVEQTVSTRPETIVKGRVKKFGGTRIVEANGDNLGDIDVLVAAVDLRVLILIECKALEPARTPREIQNEFEKLLEDGQSRESTVTKHLKRVRWVEGHLSLVLHELGVEHSDGWTVRALLVSDIELHSPYFRVPPFPFWTLKRLASEPLEQVFGVDG